MLTLIRGTRTGNAILGRLYHNGGFICWTLENAGKAIPAGLYSIKNSISPKFKRELPLVYSANVPANRGIRIHVGNSVKDSIGCILVGMGRNYVKPNAELSLLESSLAETMVAMLCRSVTEMAIVE
jgi:hypothetical protein